MRWRVLAATAAIVSGAFVLSAPTAEATPLPPASFQGRLVDSLSGIPLSGVVVHLTDTNGVRIPGTSVLTGPLGRFTLLATGEEHGLIVDGGAVAHEVGYVAIPRTVVPSWGSAVTFAPGQATGSCALAMRAAASASRSW